ncbi:restriction endonuclease subunit S [Sedimentibacter sp.]|uniref:restriction endonuclease subunit S n=1 Tax=Sedimentibacter sp. TaxID=1960295 RepID=UPI0028AB9B3D|nr:restriction endonuclease subunit S [Sedimentibacter sp.]
MSSNEWKTVELKEVIDFNPRESLPKNELAKKIAMEKIKPFSKVIDDYEITEFKGGTKFRNGDTLLARITPCLENGKTSQVTLLGDNEVGFGSTEYIVMRKKTGITDDDYVFYLAISPSFREVAIKSMVGSSGRQRVQQDELENLKINLPLLPEQKAIAATLSCLDDKIELNNCMNKTLEEIAQAIFKSWFVDFEPFQDGEFEESELGLIPKGWRVVNVDSVTIHSCTGGDAIQKTPMVDYNTGVKCVRVGDLSNQRGIDGWGYCKVDDDNFKKYQLKKNDIIVTRTATLGLNQIVEEDLMAVFNNGLIRLRLSDEIIPTFFYYVINTDKYREYIGRIESESSTRPNMKMNYLLKYQFVCPPKDIQQEFLQVVEVIRAQRLWLQKQNVTLVNTRDSLLPKLMSGEIRVPIEEVK